MQLKLAIEKRIGRLLIVVDRFYLQSLELARRVEDIQYGVGSGEMVFWDFIGVLLFRLKTSADRLVLLKTWWFNTLEGVRISPDPHRVSKRVRLSGDKRTRREAILWDVQVAVIVETTGRGLKTRSQYYKR